MTEPTKVAAGKFAIYQTPKGGMHLTLQVDGEEEPRHMDFPPLMVKMILRKASANGFSENVSEKTLRVIDAAESDTEV